MTALNFGLEIRMKRRMIFAAASLVGLLVVQPASAASAQDRPIAKAYVIGEFTVRNPIAYDRFKATIGPVVKKYGGRYLVRNGRVGGFEGPVPTGPVVVIEFDNYEAATAFERSPENRAAAALRRRASKSRIFIVEGLAP